MTDHVHGIAPAIIDMAIPIDELHLLEDNPRQGDVGAVMADLDRLGLRYPIVYREEASPSNKRKKIKVVLAGNTRLKAAQLLGWSHIAAVSANDLTEDEARAFSLADNRTGDLGTYDDELLLRLLEDFDPEDELFAAIGYDDKFITELTDDLEAFPDIDDLGNLDDFKFMVVIECDSEERQAEVLNDLKDRPGLAVKASRV